MAKRKKVIKNPNIERDDNTSMAYRRDEMKKKASGVMPYEEDKEYCSCDCDCGKKVCESCKLEKRPEDVKEFKNYNVTHKKTGKKYRVTAMHDKSAKDKARRMHGGTASRYSGTSTDDFHVEDIDAIHQARREAEAQKIKDLFGEACYKHNGKKKVSEEEKFEPHMMYDPKTGKGYKAETEADHIKYKKMGYTHEKPDVKAEDSEWPRPFSKSERDDFLKKKKRVPGDNVKHQMRPKGVSAGEAGRRKLAKVAQGDKNRKLAKEELVGPVNELYPSHNTGTIDMDKHATPKQKKARADHAKKRAAFAKKYPNASTSEIMTAKLSKEDKDTHITKDGKKAKKGLWYYINKKKESGKAKAKPGDKDYPSKKAFKMASENEEYMNEFFNNAIQNLIEKSAAEVLKKRYASDHADDNPQATKRIKDHIPGMKTYKMHPGAKFQKSTGTYSKKGKMAALKKQHARRPEQYGITREEDAMQEDIKKAAKIPFKKEYKQGNYSGAHKEIVKKYGEKTVKHPKVQNALRTANEDKTELLKKVIERSMDLTPSKIEFKTFNEVAGQRGRPKRGEGRDSEGHIIMQLRSAQDLKGNKDIKFRRGVAKVKPQHIDKILKVHDHPTMKPIMKRKLRVAISKSHNDLVRVANKVK